MASWLNTVIPGAIVHADALRREREKQQAAMDLEREKLAELKRQHDLQYGTTSIGEIEPFLKLLGVPLPQYIKPTGTFSEEKSVVPGSEMAGEPGTAQVETKQIPQFELDAERNKALREAKIPRTAIPELIKAVMGKTAELNEFQTYVQAKNTPEHLRTPLQVAVIKKREEPTTAQRPISSSQWPSFLVEAANKLNIQWQPGQPIPPSIIPIARKIAEDHERATRIAVGLETGARDFAISQGATIDEALLYGAQVSQYIAALRARGTQIGTTSGAEAAATPGRMEIPFPSLPKRLEKQQPAPSQIPNQPSSQTPPSGVSTPQLPPVVAGQPIPGPPVIRTTPGVVGSAPNIAGMPNASAKALLQRWGQDQAEWNMPVRDKRQNWINPKSGEFANEAQTPAQLVALGFAHIDDKSRQATSTARQALGQISEYRDLANKLLTHKRNSTLSGLLAVQGNRANIWLLEKSGDPDARRLAGLHGTIAGLARATGDTANIAVAEREMLRETVVTPEDTIESANAKLDQLERVLQAVLKGWGTTGFFMDEQTGRKSVGGTGGAKTAEEYLRNLGVR